MQSDTSSSAKRSTSEEPRVDSGPSYSLSAADFSRPQPNSEKDDIDMYLEDQEEAGPPTSIVLRTEDVEMIKENMEGVRAANVNQELQRMTGPEKLAFVEKEKQMPMVVGSKWHVISHAWFRRWQRAVSGVEDKEGSITETELGPVDNGDILDAHGYIPRGVVEGIDVEFVPGSVMQAFIQW